MAAGKYNIIIDQGSDYTLGLTLVTSGIANDLTGYFVRGQIRVKKTSASITATFVAMIADASLGTIAISLTNATTKALSPGLYYYDIEIYKAADALVIQILQGTATVRAEVTR